MKPLPMPIRVAAGLVATVLEEAEHLPRKLTELPVTAVSQALRHAMRIQQTVTDLAIKGDRALGALRPVPEAPSWARFDEDEQPPPVPGNGRGAAGSGGRFDAAEPYAPRPPRVTPVRILPDPQPEGTDFDDGLDDLGYDAEPVPEVPAPRVPASPAEAPGAEAPAKSGPPGLKDYDDWNLPQLRARFRSLKPHQLQALLDWETEHRNRPPYVTMLSNRIASVTGR
jgi:hypothetical protein